jgi:hypothetical protein
MPLRQEVVNVVLAQLLERRGLIAVPEEIVAAISTGASGPVRMPDVLVDYQGLRTAIEAEFASTPNAEERAFDKAKERVDQNVAQIGVAVVYPARLRNGFSRLPSELERARLSFTIVTEPVVNPSLFPGWSPSFDKGNVNDLAEALRRAYEQLVRDETLQRAVAMMEAKIEAFLNAISAQPAATERLAVVLGLRETPDGHAPMGLVPRERMAVNRISALIIMNAMIFQEVLSQGNAAVKPLTAIGHSTALVSEIAEHWKFILEEINYYPIFHTALALVRCLAAERSTEEALESLLDTSLWVVAQRASLRHDLAGRIYHRILAEAKYLGAFYTSIPAATLLLKLAFARGLVGIDWSSLSAIQELAIADLACGTGTLLLAAADVAMDNYVRATVDRGAHLDLPALHHALIERVIYGYDVLPSAVHLTASTLSLRIPQTPVDVTHLYQVPLGGPHDALGTLEFLHDPSAVATLYGEQQQILGAEAATRRTIELPALDLCAMNPPFTRSVGGNLLFGNLPASERKRLQRKLQAVVRRRSVSASITAGLGSVFVALANAYMKEGGRLALVLPHAVLSGVTWQKTREIIRSDYHLEYVITSHDPDQWNFSENTNLSEALIVARKLGSAPGDAGAKTVCVNVWRQPVNSVEALSAAHSLLDGEPPDVETGQGALPVNISGNKAGEAVSVPWEAFRDSLWTMFAQADLSRALFQLRKGALYLPGVGVCGTMPLCSLGSLGEFGFDRRDIHDGFRLASGVTSYPALWGHDATGVLTMRQSPNAWLDARSAPARGRHLRDAIHLWTKAARLMIVERLRLSTMRLTAVRVDEKALSNVWWPFSPSLEISAAAEKALCLWLNSTIGMTLLLGQREQTEGPWLGFKKPALRDLLVLNVREIPPADLETLASVYDQVCDREVGRFPAMAADATRMTVDQAITHTLHLPDVTILRETLAREPIVCAEQLR